ncbi:MAG: cytochrome c biogenesis protein CcdA, partial [Rhodospirillaceae bacterium]|nr:cytochrome c biogenesis protein CcdA [Rhodospirillaceae bacterium]
MLEDISYPGVLLAGILTFLSPCILPIVPPYLAYLGGITLDQIEVEGRTDRAKALKVFRA